MLKRDKIVKVEITTLSGTVIISANSKQFTIPQITGPDGITENVLMIKGRNMPEIDADSAVYVITYMKSGDRIRYPGRVTLSTDLQFNVKLRMGSQKVMEERRRYYKVSADVPCSISFVTRGDDIVYFREPVKTIIRDFNIGGVFIYATDFEFQKGDTFMLIIEIMNEKVEIITQVLRVQTDPAGQIVGYGCRFLNVDKKREDIFASFVNKIQLETLRKQRAKEMLAEEMEEENDSVR